jgi:hypothetical protein
VVPADSDRISPVPPYSGYPPGDPSLSPTGLLPSVADLSRILRLEMDFVTPRCFHSSTWRVLQPPSDNTCGLSHPTGLGCSRFARHYSGNRACFLFLGVLRCFSSPTYLLTPYGFRRGYRRITTGGFPHSEISGSKPVRRLPGAYRSLPRPSSAPDTKAFTVCS